MKIANILACPMADGNGRCGNGKVLSCRKVVVHMVSFSIVKQPLSVANGGLTSATTVEAFSLPPKREASKKLFLMF